MKRRLFTAVIIALIIVGTGITAFAVSRGNESVLTQTGDSVVIKSLSEAKRYEETPPLDASDTACIVEGDKRNLLNNNPAPIFEKNDDLNLFYNIDNAIDSKYLSSVGARVLLKKVMTYGEYLNEFEDTPITSIAPERMIWVVRVSYPNGFMTKHGIINDAVVTGIYDAQSGVYFGFNVGSMKE